MLPPAPDPADESRWGYRRSLASRVILLTTFAVGLAVAFMAAGAYVVVRMQLQSSLDESLVDRAQAAARGQVLVQITSDYDIPSWALGAGDVRIGFVREDGASRFLDRGAVLRLSEAEIAVAAGARRPESPHGARRGHVVPPRRGAHADRRVRAGHRAVPGAAEEDPRRARPGVLPHRAGRHRRPPRWPAGRSPATACGRSAGSPSDVERIARTEDLTPLPVEGDDEVARLATAFNQMLTSLAASRDRQRRLVADAGHELRTPLTSLRTNIDLLTQADGGIRARAVRTARGPSCSTTCARSSRS